MLGRFVLILAVVVVAVVAVLVFQEGSVGRAQIGLIDGTRIAAADQEPQYWLSHGRTYSEQRYSPLERVNADNVAELGLDWYYDTGTDRGLEATPIVVDGVMFATGSWSLVFALDARTGEELWRYDPEVEKAWGAKACCDVVNRGVAVWQGRVYVGTLDGRLLALRADTGELVWETLTIDPDKPYTITGAPRIVKGRVIIGNGGAEYGVRGYITAYSADTGEQLWRFYTVPGDPSKPFENEQMQMAADTWKGGEWWKVGGGGTVWDSMAYDPALDLLYIGVGNGAPWSRYIRSPGGGDNLFLSSIVALKPETGEYVWHYQTTPGDTWDYTATQHMILADLKVKGAVRKVIMQAPKNGFFYLLDRATGELLSAENYVPITWATHVDMETGRPVENPANSFREQEQLVTPSPYGGHNWHPMSYSPKTGLVYIPALEIPNLFRLQDEFTYERGGWNTGMDFSTAVPPKDPKELEALLKTIRGHLSAWDPVAQVERWRVQYRLPWNGGTMATAGNLVFQGDTDGFFNAYNADTGERLWRFFSQTGIIAPPVTYELDGEQYISVLAGYGGAFALVSGIPLSLNEQYQAGRVLTFKLSGQAALPPVSAQDTSVPQPPPAPTDTAQVARGETLYHQYCAVCHGTAAVGVGIIADLRHMSPQTHQIFQGIVRGGAYRNRGMVSFADRITEAQAEDIHTYLISRANQDYPAPQPSDGE